jgi:hypothetical protein
MTLKSESPDPSTLFCALCGRNINVPRGDTVYVCRGCTLAVCSDCYTAETLSCLVCAQNYAEIAASYEEWLSTPLLETLCQVSIGKEELRFSAKMSLLNGYVSFLLDSGKQYRIELLEIGDVTTRQEDGTPALLITYVHGNRIFRFKTFKDDPEIMELMKSRIDAAAVRMKWVATVNYLRNKTPA